MGELSNELIPDSHVFQTEGLQIGDLQIEHIMWGRRAASITIVVMTLFF